MGPCWSLERTTTGGEDTAVPGVLWGTEGYCRGYEETFQGWWKTEGPPVTFRVGVNNDGNKGCYAQLSVAVSDGIAPYELPRFRVSRQDGLWSLAYRNAKVRIDPVHRTASRRVGEDATYVGTLREDALPLQPPPTPPSEQWIRRWHGSWKGRFAKLPFAVTLRFAGSDPNRIEGRISAPFTAKTFIGRFHGEMLVFRWKNRHIGLRLEEAGDTLVHVNYRGKVFRFRRKR